MTDTNVRRARQNERYAEYKRAFDDVIGDPFAKPEPIMGHYTGMKNRSAIMVAKNNFGDGHATGNAARPNPIDFFCDVERTVEIAIDDKNVLIKFADTYIIESTETAFTAQERMYLEMKIGKAFMDHGISPVSNYFKTVRQSIGTTKRGNKEQDAKRYRR